MRFHRVLLPKLRHKARLMKTTSTTSVLSLIYNILRIGRNLFSALNIFRRNRQIKKRYEESHDAVENGDVDKINDMLKTHKN